MAAARAAGPLQTEITTSNDTHKHTREHASTTRPRKPDQTLHLLAVAACHLRCGDDGLPGLLREVALADALAAACAAALCVRTHLDAAGARRRPAELMKGRDPVCVFRGPGRPCGCCSCWSCGPPRPAWHLAATTTGPAAARTHTTHHRVLTSVGPLPRGAPGCHHVGCCWPPWPQQASRACAGGLRTETGGGVAPPPPRRRRCPRRCTPPRAGPQCAAC